MADRVDGVEALFCTGEVRKDNPDTDSIYCQESVCTPSSQPTPAQRPAQHSDPDQNTSGSSEESEGSDQGSFVDQTMISVPGATDNDTTYNAVTPDSSSTSCSSEITSSEGSLTEKEASGSSNDQLKGLSGFQTPKNDKGEVTGTDISKDIAVQSSDGSPKNRDGNTPPANATAVIGILSPKDAAQPHTGNGTDPTTSAPTPGNTAHAPPCDGTKPGIIGVGSGTLPNMDGTGTDTGMDDHRSNETPLGTGTPSRYLRFNELPDSNGTSDGTNSGTRRRAYLKPARLQYSVNVPDQSIGATSDPGAGVESFRPLPGTSSGTELGTGPGCGTTPVKGLIVNDTTAPKTPSIGEQFSFAQVVQMGGKRKRGSSPQSPDESTPLKRINYSPITNNNSSLSPMRFIDSRFENVQAQDAPSSFTTSTYKPAEKLIYFTIMMIQTVCTRARGEKIIETFQKYMHPTNIIDYWGPRKSVGPTFLIRHSVLEKARAFAKHCSLDFDVKGIESNALPCSSNKGNLRFTNRSPKPKSPAGSSQSSKVKAPRKAGNKGQTNKNRISTGIIENIPVSIDMSDLTKKLSKSLSSIKSLHRITTKKNKPTTNVKITFNTWPAPLIISSDKEYEVNPCKIPYLRCNFCQQHGHSTKECTASTPNCPMCAGNHTYNECTRKHKTKCTNCLSISHNAANPSCPIFKEYKKLVDTKNATTRTEWNTKRQQNKQQNKQKQTITAQVILEKEDNFPQLPTRNKHQPINKQNKQHTHNKQSKQQITAVVTMDTAEPNIHKAVPPPSSSNTQVVTKDDLKRILIEVLRSNISAKPLDEQVEIIDGIVENNFPDQQTLNPANTATAPPTPKSSTNIPKYTAAKAGGRQAFPLTSTPKNGKHIGPYSLTKQRHTTNTTYRHNQKPLRLSNRFNILNNPLIA